MDGPAWVEPPDEPGSVDASLPEREPDRRSIRGALFASAPDAFKGLFDMLAVLALPLCCWR